MRRGVRGEEGSEEGGVRKSEEEGEEDRREKEGGREKRGERIELGGRGVRKTGRE